MSDLFRDITESSRTLSPALLAEIPDFHWALLKRHFRLDNEQCAGMYRSYGAISELPHVKLLDWARVVCEQETNQKPDHLAEMGATISQAIHANDVEFFEQMVVILKARREGRELHTVTRKELLMKSRRGRQVTPHDLSVVVPWVFGRALMRRVPNLAKESYTDRCIGRGELSWGIYWEQFHAGLRPVSMISETELSRWIAKMGIAKFMGPMKLR